MTPSKPTPETLAESIMNAQLARQHEFGSAIADVDSEFTKGNRYGGGAWYAERNRVGKDELRKRAEIIRVAWRQVLDGQSARKAKKLRSVAAKHAKDRFLGEARNVGDMAVPKAGTRFPAGDPKILDAEAERIADELFAVLLLPPTTPEKSWLVRQFQDQTSAVIGLIIAAIVGALIARGGDVWHIMAGDSVRPPVSRRFWSWKHAGTRRIFVGMSRFWIGSGLLT